MGYLDVSTVYFPFHLICTTNAVPQTSQINQILFTVTQVQYSLVPNTKLNWKVSYTTILEQICLVIYSLTGMAESERLGSCQYYAA